MVKQCGATAQACFLNVGDWLIEYTIPTAQYIRYKYPGEDWQEVKVAHSDLTYELTQEPPPFTGGQCSFQYTVRVRLENSQGDVAFKDLTAYGGLMNGPIASLELNWRNPMNGQIATSGFPCTSYFNWTVRGLKFRLVVSKADGSQYIFQSVNANVYTGAQTVTVCFDSLFPTFGQPDHCGDLPTDCIFTVKDADNNVVFQRTEADCPEGQEIPCQYEPQNLVSFTYPNKYPFGFLQVLDLEENGQKCREMLVSNYLPTGNPGSPFGAQFISLGKICSPKGCPLFPKICWDCDGKKGCPEGTCLKCLDKSTGKICCYSGEGKVLAVVDRDAERPDC